MCFLLASMLCTRRMLPGVLLVTMMRVVGICADCSRTSLMPFIKSSILCSILPRSLPSEFCRERERERENIYMSATVWSLEQCNIEDSMERRKFGMKRCYRATVLAILMERSTAASVGMPALKKHAAPVAALGTHNPSPISSASSTASYNNTSHN